MSPSPSKGLRGESGSHRGEVGSSRREKSRNAAAGSAKSSNILLFLIAFRVLNALTIRTFFQPDEYFQSLEPAWQMVFGADSGAWITWEWRERLRSSIHPAIFAAVYYASSRLATSLSLAPSVRAELLVAAPKLTQAVFAALGDYYTWKLAERVYGTGSRRAWTALLLTVCSPWQWFCSTRTLSNCLETTLTVTALALWPWGWSAGVIRQKAQSPRPESRLRGPSLEQLRPSSDDDEGAKRDLGDLRKALLLAALACVLRPTNLLIWLCVSSFVFFGPGWRMKLISLRPRALVKWISTLSTNLVRQGEYQFVLIREGLLCGTLVLLLSALTDRWYYQTWTFPPLRFLYFNLAQSLAVFYGRNVWHYYLTQGLPLLLTTALPFAIVALWGALALRWRKSASNRGGLGESVRFQLSVTVVVVTVALSLIAHKEVRFIYPLLPMLHVVSSGPLEEFFSSSSSSLSPSSPSVTTSFAVTSTTSTENSPSSSVTSSRNSESRIKPKRFPILVILLLMNTLLSTYITQTHQSGPITLINYLRALPFEPASSTSPCSRSSPSPYPPPPNTNTNTNPATPETLLRPITITLLMPCHSTPWLSHLTHPPSVLDMHALGCEPPLHTRPHSAERAAYRDEADRFYDDMAGFLRQTYVPVDANGRDTSGEVPETSEAVETEKKDWPDYLVFFGQAEPALTAFLNPSFEPKSKSTEDEGEQAEKEAEKKKRTVQYEERARFSNGHFHDDWRRRGGIVVWRRRDPYCRAGEAGD
ncbi:MAG: hypothetical protein M1819_002757 [Sarea resinae]|nr:MAG: hypothetical protein M1819_002757 [Sarea resinae]